MLKQRSTELCICRLNDGHQGRGARPSTWALLYLFWLVCVCLCVRACEYQPPDLIPHSCFCFPLIMHPETGWSISPSLSVFLPLHIFHPCIPPPALHQPTPAIFTPHTSVAALIQPQMAAGSIDKWIIQQQSTSPSLFPSLLLSLRTPLAIGPWRRRGPYWAEPRLSTSQALYWGVYGALCCQRSALPSPSSIILGSRAAITGQTGGQSQLSRKLYRRWRKKAEGRKWENLSVSFAASLMSDLIGILCTFWVHDHTGINQH